MNALRKALLASVSLAFATPALADSTANSPIFSHYGGVGLIKTRSARMAEDSTLNAGVSWNREQQRYSLTFQAAPWLETTFSYSGFEGVSTGDTFDRQFDIKVRLWEESLYLPEVAIGLQDFLGTGVFGGEYIVANKRFGPLDLSLGVGWGLLAARSAGRNPVAELSDRFETRDGFSGQGGEVNFGNYFSGRDVGVFGGVIYTTPIKGLSVIAEYDSDRNDAVVGIDDNSPFNFGLVYEPAPGIQLGASYLAGDEFALSANFATQTGEWAQDTPPGDPPPAFYVRQAFDDSNGGRDGLIAPVQPLLSTPVDRGILPETLRDTLAQEGITLMRTQIGSDIIRVVIDNNRYRSYAKAAGRTARVLSRFAPDEIETFLIAFDQSGLETAELVLKRSQLEMSASEIGYSIAPPSLAFAYITPGSEPVDGQVEDFNKYPDFNWSIGPELRFNTFDPDDPLRVQLDLEATASLEVSRGLIFTATVGADIVGNFDNNTRASNSVLPRVRTEFNLYDEATDVGLYRLTGEYFFNPAPNVSAKLTAGYIEQMFGGFGGEVLYRPQNSRLAFGAEAFYVKQREFDTRFEFQDYEVATGHVSVYYDTPYNNWNVALHAGRYLAGDWGGTLELKRRFPNGWEVGAFATLTDVPFDDFGEGSFDKGISVRIPFDWGLPDDTKSSGGILLRPVQRDGGQRLAVPGRLFDVTQPTSRGEVASQWATFAH